ncbi:MAG: hypothetical protein PHR83_05925 [Paludibacter sp.]|nr:hypothetical protein [Paludibacter sp.]
MKTKYILISILISIFCVTLTAANTYTINQNQPISITSLYTNNASETYNVISTVTDKPLLINYTIGTEYSFDFLTINNVDNNGNVTSQLMKISGTKSGTIAAVSPNGRVQIVFTSDGSVCYANNTSLYSGVSITFGVDNISVSGNSIQVGGNGYFNGRVGIGTVSPNKKLEVWDNGGLFSFSGSNNTSGYEIAQTIDNTGYKLNVGSSVRDYRIAMNGTDRFTILPDGTVGIGTTVTPTKLNVTGVLRANSDIYGTDKVTFQNDARFTVTNTAVPNLRDASFSMPQYGIAAPLTTSSADLWLSGNSGIRMFTGSNVNPAVNILTNGNVGIGTAAPNAKLEVHGTTTIGQYTNGTAVIDAYNSYAYFGCNTTPNGIAIGPTGSVGIGTATPNPLYLLDVKGTIRATEVKIVSVDNFPDFVFDPEYKLPSLGQVSSFIQTNKHLPNIPSASDVKENGINMIEMQNKLLQKVEELTLYVIEQQKQIDELKKNQK